MMYTLHVTSAMSDDWWEIIRYKFKCSGQPGLILGEQFQKRRNFIVYARRHTPSDTITHLNLWTTWIRVMVFNATFNYILVISWQSVLLVEKITNLLQVTDKLLSHNGVSSISRLSRIQTHNFGGDQANMNKTKEQIYYKFICTLCI